jgi:hypothetical protein
MVDDRLPHLGLDPARIDRRDGLSRDDGQAEVHTERCTSG